MGVVRHGVLLALDVREGVDVEISSDVPIGAGLSSSAALECSVAVALDEAFSARDATHEEIVAACVRAEQEYVGAPTGGLDQAIAVYGEASHALLIDFATGRREQVPFDPAAHGLGAAGDRHEGQPRAHRRRLRLPARRGVGGGEAARPGRTCARPSDLDGLSDPLLRRARHVVSEVARVDAFVEALRRGRLGRARSAAGRLARLAARRLRGVLRGARRGRRRGARVRCGRSPDDRRRLRRLGDRPGADRAGRRGAGSGDHGVRGARLGPAGVHRRRAGAPAPGSPTSTTRSRRLRSRRCGTPPRRARGRAGRDRRRTGRSRRCGR